MDPDVLEMALPAMAQPMEIPESSSSTHGMTGGQGRTTNLSSLIPDSLPPRSTSPPLPPRKYGQGLPPTYLSHLRKLLRQWLEQQLKAKDDGLPAVQTDEGDNRLWDERRVRQIEEILWEGVIAPGASSHEGGAIDEALLTLDWNAWAVGAAERRKVWRAEQTSKEETSARKDGEHVSDKNEGKEATLKKQTKEKKSVKPKREGSSSDPENTPSSKLGPRVALDGSKTPSTPKTGSSPRPPSIASTSEAKDARKDGKRSPQDEGGPAKDGLAERAETERIQDWCQSISSLKGFEPFQLPPSNLSDLDEGGLCIDDSWSAADPSVGLRPGSQHSSVRSSDFPGAFPSARDAYPTSSLNSRTKELPSLPTPASSSIPAPTPAAITCRLLKPVFCLTFPLPEGNASSSTLQLYRHGSTSSMRRRSVNSVSARWWPTNAGSLSFTGGRDEPLKSDFVSGQYALPRLGDVSRKPSTVSKRSPASKHKRGNSKTSLRFGSPDTLDVHDSGEDSSGSDTEPADSRLRRPRERSYIIGGGQDDVPDQAIDDHKCQIVGGTVMVRGMTKTEEQQALARVLRVLLYTISVMFLELEVLDAFRVPREVDPSKSSDGAPAVPSKSSYSNGSGNVRRSRSTKERAEKAKGFFNRLGRDTRGIFGGLMPRARKESTPGSRDTMSSSFFSPPTTPLSTNFSIPISTPTSTYTMDSTNTPPISQTTDRHLRTLARLESLLASPTPGLKIPMPTLLLRVREEDRVRREKARQEIKDGAPAESPSFFLNGGAGSGTTTPIRDPLKGRAVGYRMGGDVRAGLGALISGIEAFEGWIHLQRLETLFCSQIDDGGGLCARPKAKSYVFWDEDQDCALENFTKTGVERLRCGVESCKGGQESHVFWWMHGRDRVGMKVKELKEPSEGVTDVWTRCTVCGVSTEPRNLSEPGRLYSFSKLLDLLLYGFPLHPPDPCKHTDPPHKPQITHFVRSPTHIIAFFHEPVTVLETRLPKMQVGPNVGKRKTGKANAEAAINSLTSRDRKESQLEALKGQVESVFGVLSERLRLLERYVQAERDMCPADEMEKRDEDDASHSEDHPTAAATSLSALGENLGMARSELMDSVSRSSPANLNDIRNRFASKVQVAQDEMAAWQKEHDVPEDFSDLPLDLPEYMTDPRVHTLPGSSILVRENEPSSVFAYALSSLPYFLELASGGRAVPTDSASTETGTNVETVKPDTDEWTIEVKRRDNPRDLLSLRALAKKRSEASMPKLDSKSPMTPKPNQPSLELSLEQVEGTISKGTISDSTNSTSNRPRSPSASESDNGNGHVTPRAAPSRMVRRTSDSDHVSAPPSSFRPSMMRSVSHTVPPSPKLSAVIPPTATASRPHTPETASVKEGWGSSVTSSLTSSFNSLLRMGSDMGSIRMRGTDRTLTSLIGPLSMMSAMDNSLSPHGQDDRPHIQFTYSLDDKLKISCTIYYATAFDSLRRRCAIDKSMVASLARCDIWDAQGGKSKASFFMTHDKRYIVKELVSKWNVSDTQALLEIAPVYFEHLAGTHNKATALTKIVGFFTVKIHDVKNSNKKQMDLLVMENLFYKQSISQTFDLKGIEGRKAPKGVGESSIQFDSEWIEGQTRSPILLYPHAKRILQEAVALDTRFLCRESIMDYSLLLGLDPLNKELVVGLVDAIGSFNLFKTIESRGKLALTRGGEVTVIPPDQYRERFENAVKQYFIVRPEAKPG